MSSKDRKYPIPPGFVWSHADAIYKHPDGRTWDSDTNITRDKDGVALKTSIELPIDPIEHRIQSLGLTAPRVTPQDVEAAIKGEEYVVKGTLTICVLTLQNDYQVTGESACADPANFNEKLGRDLARTKAKEKIWPLLGYALRDRLHQGA